MLTSFAEIPAEIRRRVHAGERTALILLDGLGRQLLARHEDHPFVRRLTLTPLCSQFPSTTTAHVTTLHWGLPVGDHGLYEWNVLEPALGEIICPLRFDVAGGHREGSLAGRLDPTALSPGLTFYETLGARSTVLAPARIGGSRYSELSTRGADRVAFGELAEGVAALIDALSGAEASAYGLLYWDQIDAAGHEHGPDSPEFAAAARSALDVLEHSLGAGAGSRERELTVLLCADHGQVAVAPDRVDYLDELWPALPSLLTQPRPAGSARDAFLHVAPGRVDAVIAGLSERLDGRAQVRHAAELFEHIGPRLAARMAEVAVLPVAGRQAWMRGATGGEQWFRGHHGGFEPAERETYLAELSA